MSIDKIKTGDDLTQSLDIVSDNISKLKELFPEVLTEGKIDFKVLQDILGNEIEEDEEFYRFTWAGKSQSRREAHKPSTGTLRPCKEESVDWDSTQNLYIEGDNLEVLKLLQKSYSNKVKMIYIDPPYNTGNDFVYKDDYKDNLKNYQQVSGQVDDEGNKLTTNTNSDGRYHSNWLNMIFPRLRLSRNLLTNDGVIFISIDDCEYTNLKKVSDEIFGENNFIATIIRNTNSSKNQSLFVSVSHEYCLVYSKSIDYLKEKHNENKWSVPKNNTDEYLKKINQLKKEGLGNDEISEELKTLTKYPRFIDFTNYWYFDEKGLYRKDNLGGVKNGNVEPIFNPLIGDYDKIPPGGYRYNKEKIESLINDNRIHFHTDGSLPVLKRYLHENEEQRPKSIMSDDQRPDYSLLAKFNTPFDNPKQLSFMKRIISLTDKDSIVLDFFSGSGTTAHAVLEQNIIDGGKRKHIQIQLPELTDEKSEAFKSGYKTITEIGKERIRKAGNKIKEENQLNSGNLDIGFKVFKLDSSNIKGWSGLPENLENSLFDSQDNIKSDRTEEDVLFEILLKYGLDLTLAIEEKVIEGKKVFSVGFGALFICLGNELTSKVAEGIGHWKETLKPETCRVIFKDGGFTDVEKTNSVQTLKRFGIQEIKSI
jgi:adenine-specific DNA-methyltransferase